MLDLVNHPPHYTTHPSGLEAIELTGDMMFCPGSAVKYLWRKDLKGARDMDVGKAVWYLKYEIERKNRFMEVLARFEAYAKANPQDETAGLILMIANGEYEKCLTSLTKQAI
jgi:hypothetical protein